MNSLAPFASPLYVMSKPVGSLCNLACKYCYYLEKSHLYTGQPDHAGFLMSEETLEVFIRQYIESQTSPQVLFTWHGGEPLMRPLSFYRKVLELQRRYAATSQFLSPRSAAAEALFPWTPDRQLPTDQRHATHR